MTSLPVEPFDGVPDGVQAPRIESAPDFVSTSGAEAREVCELAGLFLDPWQQHVLDVSLGERPDGKWAAFEVGLVVSRQNGKGGILEARELAGLFVLGERFIIHSAHQFDTSLEAFRRLLGLIEGVPEFDRRIKRVSRSHGEEGIELHGGQRIRFRTRTGGGGRGFTADGVILDEAMDIPARVQSALLPTLSARPNPQIWYTGSAVDQVSQENGVVFAKIRERGIAGDRALAFFDWSADLELASITPAQASDPAHWAAANPALGIRISAEYVENEYASMIPRGFAVERLGVGDWPDTDTTGRVIPLEAWEKVCGAHKVDKPVVFAFDVNPKRTHGSIVAVGAGPTVEVVDYREGTHWLVDRCVELRDKYRATFAVDRGGPGGSFVEELQRKRVRVVEVDRTDMTRATGAFYDAVMDGTLAVRSDPDLDAAVAGALRRSAGDAWAWDRKQNHDISLLVAATAGVWVFSSKQSPRVVSMADALRNAGELD